MAESWRGFLADAGSGIGIVGLKGLEAARNVFVRMLHGAGDPARGIIIEPWFQAARLSSACVRGASRNLRRLATLSSA